MYSLRSINNMYSEHAGSRSDFIILGHPEFKLGKAHFASRSYSASWDARPLPAHPSKSIARSRSTGALVQQLSSPPPWCTLKEKALQKASTKNKMQVLPTSPRGGAMSSFAAFEEALKNCDYGNDIRTAASVAQNKGHFATSRNFAELHKQVLDVKEKMKADPKKTRASLKSTGSWKVFAVHLEQEKKMEAQLRAERARMHPAVAAAHEKPGPASSTH
eukprot:TRINITY_DN21163_c0_g1_i1.p1 TRINITY_DN21163_c0_g1~~TRINITY_DN21163_c0_g1_i1.p1  ORF type:complete len:218 (-),score=41.89 TRINITY_DN21163_c0_g1_i1:133-786(-)